MHADRSTETHTERRTERSTSILREKWKDVQRDMPKDMQERRTSILKENRKDKQRDIQKDVQKERETCTWKKTNNIIPTFFFLYTRIQNHTHTHTYPADRQATSYMGMERPHRQTEANRQKYTYLHTNGPLYHTYLPPTMHVYIYRERDLPS